jgi:hypothetical protein
MEKRGLSPNSYTEDTNVVTQYSVFFRVIPWPFKGLYKRYTLSKCHWVLTPFSLRIPRNKKSGYREVPGLQSLGRISYPSPGNTYLNSLDLSTRSVWARLKQVHVLLSLL